MGSINSRQGRLYLDFRYKGVRCREQTDLSDTQANRRKLKKLLSQIEADMRLGCFVYSECFPGSKRAEIFVREDKTANQRKSGMMERYALASNEVQGISTIRFEDFASEWFTENEVRWKESYKDSMRIYLRSYLIPQFGDLCVDKITRPDILKYRASLTKKRANGKRLSSDFINHIMTPLRMMMIEAAERYEFKNPFVNIKQLKVNKRDVNPFSLEQVLDFLDVVRPEYRDYFTVRFFTGMRSSEIDGLKWRYVNFEQRCVSIRETYVHGRMDTTKTTGSHREIHMSSIVYDAMMSQRNVTGEGEFVFCNSKGNPFDKRNIRERIWKPALVQLGMSYRRPYETRHTAATLWLAAGESPEWIAKQMGHTTTKMLFEVYSRFIPNLTRQDGSAFEKLLEQKSNKESK
ncbi:integrase [Vibrio panuliri]|uniref:Integrase n=1 Tax=Vibrio panuliri TaxID=1381081 RepID=A0A1Q9HF72_9VIBR|nr:site-specific integrase [Vibrio panuliri]OLQ88351.1 integrase [Vibrio panuliri]